MGKPATSLFGSPWSTPAGLGLGLALGALLGLATWELLRRGVGLFVVLPVVILGGALRQAAPFWAAFFLGLAAGAVLTLVYLWLMLVR